MSGGDQLTGLARVIEHLESGSEDHVLRLRIVRLDLCPEHTALALHVEQREVAREPQKPLPAVWAAHLAYDIRFPGGSVFGVRSHLVQSP